MLAIRRVRRSDLAHIYNFVCELEAQRFDRLRFATIFNRNLTNPQNIYLMAVETKPVGFISCHAQTLLHHCDLIAEIQEMYVMPASRGREVGKALLLELKKIARKKKIAQIEVTSNVRRRRAHQFYIREGFTLTSKKFVYPVK